MVKVLKQPDLTNIMNSLTVIDETPYSRRKVTVLSTCSVECMLVLLTVFFFVNALLYCNTRECLQKIKKGISKKEEVKEYNPETQE